MINQIKLHIGYVGKPRNGERVEIVDSHDIKGYMGDNEKYYWFNGVEDLFKNTPNDIIGPWVDEPAPDYNNGKWHGWNGGECPVHPETVVDVVLDSGARPRPVQAGAWDWGSIYIPIIAYRIIREHKEPTKPREFWVWRDCKGRVNHVFTTKTTKDDVHFLVGDEIIHVREVLDT